MEFTNIAMANRLNFTRCSAPTIGLYEPTDETILVTLKGDLLTISDTGLFLAPNPTLSAAQPPPSRFAANNRIYGSKIDEVGEKLIFELLEEPPQPDIKPFPVLIPKMSPVSTKIPGRAELWVDGNGRHCLHAYGTDDGSDRRPNARRANCRGWIFDATEENAVPVEAAVA